MRTCNFHDLGDTISMLISAISRCSAPNDLVFFDHHGFLNLSVDDESARIRFI